MFYHEKCKAHLITWLTKPVRLESTGPLFSSEIDLCVWRLGVTIGCHLRLLPLAFWDRTSRWPWSMLFQLAWLSPLTLTWQTCSALPCPAFASRCKPKAPRLQAQGSLCTISTFPNGPFPESSKKATACWLLLFCFPCIPWLLNIQDSLFFSIESIWEVWCRQEGRFFGSVFYSGPTPWRGQKGVGKRLPSSTKQHSKETAPKWHRRWMWWEHPRESSQERSANCCLPWYSEIKRVEY